MKAYSSSCQAVRKRRQKKNNLNQLMNKTLDTTGSTESTWRQQRSGLSWRSRNCAKQEQRHICYLAERLGKNDGISPFCILSKPHSLWQCSHCVVNCVTRVPTVKTVHTCEVHCSPGPGSREPFRAENRFITAASVPALTAATLGRKKHLLLWTTREAALSLQLGHCPPCTFQHGGVGFFPPRRPQCDAQPYWWTEQTFCGNPAVEVRWEFHMCF